MAFCLQCMNPLPPSYYQCGFCGAPRPSGSRAPVPPPFFPPSCNQRLQPSRKRALLIGVAYLDSNEPLPGAINDVTLMKSLLCRKFGFQEPCIRVLSDQQPNQRWWPTRANIKADMRWLVEGCQPGDSLVFYFSGHGKQEMDDDGDEMDGRDECLCPMDFERMGTIRDDRVHDLMVRPLRLGVKLHAIVDACHSGSVLDLPYVCSMDRRGNFLGWNRDSNVVKGTQGGITICFSACEDSRASAQIRLPGGAPGGLMTSNFVNNARPGLTYRDILHYTRKAIRGDERNLSQVTQLSSTWKFDVDQGIFDL